MSERAVVLAGGRGTRLRPYTIVLPKPLMPLGDIPILEVIVRQLARHGFGHITLAVGHQADIIKAFFGDGTKWQVRIDYSLESEPLSTVAPLKLIEDLPENFLLLNGDVLTDLDFGGFYRAHLERKGVFTIAATRRKHTIDYGVLGVDESSNLISFTEKPVDHYLVSMGVYALNRAVMSFVPANRKYGFDDLMIDLLARGEKVQVRVHPGYWLDIGRPDDYSRAIEEFDRHKSVFLGHD